MPTCPSDNQQAVDQTDFWTDGGIEWDAHRIGWVVAGACAVATVIISFISVLQHCRYSASRTYTNPAEQRQILRILYMPPVYAIISFFSYRYFRSYTYYELGEVVYEAFTLSAFLMLLIEFVAASGSGHKAESSIARKGKRSLPFPFCHWRYRPTKPYFMYTLKWAVLQYVIFRPTISVVGIICQALNVLCESEGFNFHYANVYLEAFDFVSISVALYGLFLFYGLTKEELAGRRPLAKFLAIKLIVVFTWYQSFVFDALEGRVIHALPSNDVLYIDPVTPNEQSSDCKSKMIFFACFMWWAYTPAAYRIQGAKSTSIWRPLWDSINFNDFAFEIWYSFRFFISYLRGVPETHSRFATAAGFDKAFGLATVHATYAKPSNSTGVNEHDPSRPVRMSYDEDVRLSPYGDAGDGPEDTFSLIGDSGLDIPQSRFEGRG
ncbi:DUF300-domain-containing protein [Lentinula aciculospora]|uniref:DUF300-domain-containing protein n=1 Tax=Lentinula aciculospora TaxID=153920 RepID=A0A9W8ZS68_9AGAR|nr:DUF300-domain-containing protein [Lentinula aciculospora]